MGAAVLEDVQLAINVAGHDHWKRADIGPYVIAWFRYFAFEPDVIPVAAEKNLLDFALIDVLIGVDPVGYARFISRPVAVVTGMPVDFCYQPVVAVHRSFSRRKGADQVLRTAATPSRANMTHRIGRKPPLTAQVVLNILPLFFRPDDGPIVLRRFGAGENR